MEKLFLLALLILFYLFYIPQETQKEHKQVLEKKIEKTIELVAKKEHKKERFF